MSYWIDDRDVTESKIQRLESELSAVTRERDEARDRLQRSGFVRCDIPACNCGSWHQRYGLPERMREIEQTLEDAGHPLNNDNGHLTRNALAQLVNEKDALRAEVERLRGALLALANAADTVGVMHFDSDSWPQEVDAMRDATIAARAALQEPTP